LFKLKVQHAYLALLGCTSLRQSIFIPPSLTGPLEIGVVSYELNNTSIYPTRDLMVSIFYPASPSSWKYYPLAPDFGPQTDAYTDEWIAFTPSSSAAMEMLAYDSAPISPEHEDVPVLFFSPGYGNSRVYYSGAAQDLASSGYIVVTMDHPFDSDFIEYFDDRNATYVENDTDADLAGLTERRVSDILFILDDLEVSHEKTRIPGQKGALQLEKVGALGHSLGGCTAAALMFNGTHFIVGVNMDGSMAGPVMTEGLDEPFLLLASAGHVREYDKSWAIFYDALRGWKRDIRMNNTEHHHYSDTLYLENVLRPDGDPANAGFLRGGRMYEIENAFLTAFFDKWFKGDDGRILDGPSEEFPEAIFDWCGCVDDLNGCVCAD
jgi:alpha-beta hydrolase superfamily lysophospholipase